eukprot:767236-Hanusia_phi.AAC.1
MILARQPREHNEKISPMDMQAARGEILKEKIDKDFDEDSHEEEDRDWCVICLEGKSTHAYIPCGHLAVCQECKNKSPSLCPICNQKRIIYELVREGGSLKEPEGGREKEKEEGLREW